MKMLTSTTSSKNKNHVGIMSPMKIHSTNALDN